MASWQFDVQLFQGSSDAPLPLELREAAAQLLPLRFGVSDEMLEGWFVFGSETGNRIDLVELEDGECEIHARFDARAADTDLFVQDVCKVAVALNCQFFSPEHDLVLEPTPPAVMDALKRSTAWQYALDPRTFLRNLKNPP